MTDKKLTPDDARALLSDHVEGALDDDTRAEVDALLASDAALAAERRRLAATMSLLQTLPRPEPPADVVGKVRDRLAAERRSALEASGAADAPPARFDDGLARRARRGWRRFGGIEAAMGLSALAAVAVLIAVAGHEASSVPAGPAAGTIEVAGTSGGERAVTATLVVPGVPHSLVAALAAKAGMETVDGNVYEGDRRAAARFLIELKTAAAERGVEVSGFVPDATRVRLEIR